MIQLHLSRAERDAYVEALLSSHAIKIEVDILNANEKPIGSLTNPSHMVVDGAVQVEATEDIGRSLTLTLLDPKGKLAFVPDHPGQGGMYAENFIAVRYCVHVAELNDWVDVPVFWGPITMFEHSEESVSIEAQSKESLGLSPHLIVQGYTLRKNTEIGEAIKRVMRQIGERRFNLPRLRRKLTGDWPIPPQEEPWRVIVGGSELEGAKKGGLVARTGEVEHHAFYDGRGKLTIRRKRKHRSFTFRGRSVLTKPVIRYDIAETINYVKVRGGRPKGAKKRVNGSAKLKDSHPMSPERLGRNGERRYMVEFIDAENLKTTKACNNRAEDVLRSKSKVGLDASFEALVIPHLEPYDRVAVETVEGVIEFDLRSYTIPLTATEGMSIGHTKRIKQRRPKRRKGKGKR